MLNLDDYYELEDEDYLDDEYPDDEYPDPDDVRGYWDNVENEIDRMREDYDE